MKIRYIKRSAFINRASSNESGFTLIELMVAITIAMMIVGSVYAAFRSSLKLYQSDETKMIMLQRCRMALDRISRDINNMFYIENDDQLVPIVQDYADSSDTNSETNMDKDMISFVTIVDPNIKTYLENLENDGSTSSSSNNSSSEENTNPLPSDLTRVIYFITNNPENENIQSLMRVELTNLDTEEAQDMLTELQSTSPTEEVLSILRSSILVDNVAGLNFRYFDGNDWVDTWDMEEAGALPKAIQITLFVTDPDNKGKPLTEATQVYLPFSSSASSGTDQPEGTGQNSGASTQGPGM